jgi:two-component system, LuxR family, response regulator TtrR
MMPILQNADMQLEEIQLNKSGEMSTDKKQIYIVDDDESVCSSLKVLLVGYEFRVRTFSSAEEFLSAVPNSAPGLLILDIHMPGLNGWDTLLRLSKSGSQRPVIVMTVDKNEGLGESALRVGVAGFFQKPIDGQKLVNLINQSSINEKEYK